MGILYVLIAVQFGTGLYPIISSVVNPGQCSCLIAGIPRVAGRKKPFSIVEFGILAIPLDSYRLCLPGAVPNGLILAMSSLAVGFGK